MSKYGYVGKESDIPQQAFKSNAGVLSVNDHLALSQENKLTQYGQLELIETQIYSTGVASIDFTSIQENTYDVHFLTLDNFQTATDNIEVFQIQLYENGTLETASVYDYTFQRSRLDGAFTEYSSSTSSHLKINQNGGNATNETSCGYVYFYHLGDSSLYSFATSHSIVTQNDSVQNIAYGSSLLPQQSKVDGIRIKTSSGNYSSFKASLYGIRIYE